jgi:hypothetical protein
MEIDPSKQSTSVDSDQKKAGIQDMERASTVKQSDSFSPRTGQQSITFAAATDNPQSMDPSSSVEATTSHPSAIAPFNNAAGPSLTDSSVIPHQSSQTPLTNNPSTHQTGGTVPLETLPNPITYLQSLTTHLDILHRTMTEHRHTLSRCQQTLYRASSAVTQLVKEIKVKKQERSGAVKAVRGATVNLTMTQRKWQRVRDEWQRVREWCEERQATKVEGSLRLVYSKF